MQPDSASRPSSTPWRKRVIIWLGVVALGALGVYLTDVVRSFLDSAFAPAAQVGEQLAGDHPIKVVDLRRLSDPAEGAHAFVFPGGDVATLDQVLSRPTGRLDADWLTRVGAVDVGRSTWEITLSGTRTETTEIVDMRPVLIGPCRAPLGGVFLENPSAGAGDKIPLVTRVDKPSPVFNDPQTDKPFFATKKISLPRDEKNVIQIQAYTETGTCEWRIAITYIADGARHTMTISAPNDKPFTVTGSMDYARYDWVYFSSLHGCVDEAGRYYRPRHPGAAVAGVLRRNQNRPCPQRP